MTGQFKKMLKSQDTRTKGGNMADCASGGIKKTCWICSDEEYCKFPVCYEQETTETIKREEEEEGD